MFFSGNRFSGNRWREHGRPIVLAALALSALLALLVLSLASLGASPDWLARHRTGCIAGLVLATLVALASVLLLLRGLRQLQQERHQALLTLRGLDERMARAHADVDASLPVLARRLADWLLENEGRRHVLEQQKYAVDRHAIVSTCDLDGRITYANDLFCTMSGYGREELIGQNHRILKSGEHSQAFWNDCWDSLVHGEVWQGEICNRHKSGALYWVRATLVPVLDAQGFPEQYIAIRTDISRRKRIEHDLQLAKEEAERANQAKNFFLASMSHEVRTPLNVMLGLAQVLDRGGLDSQQRDMVQGIRVAGQVLLRNLNDVLDFSKIEAGQMTLEQRPFKLDEVLDKLCGLLLGLAQAEGLRLDWHMPESPPQAHLSGDAARLSQILLNLVGNAIKFTPSGWVSVNVSVVQQDGEHCRLRFEVSDSGIGIQADKLGTLFQPFVQADTTVMRRFGGSGLGLSICKRLVDLMGGQTGVRSVEGQGSTFWFELPFGLIELPVAAEADAVPADAGVPSGVSGCRVLVVDDCEMSRDMMRRMLGLSGAVVTLAEDGEQALRLLQANPDGFDAVLLDLQMPVMDGPALMRAIRQQAGLAELPLLVCSAGVQPQDRIEALAAGANDFVTKPVDFERLVALLARLTSRALSIAPNIESHAAEAQDWPQIDGIDGASIQAQFDGDREFFIGLLGMLVKEIRLLLQELPALLAEDSQQTLARRLHKLRGAAGVVGAQPLVGACRAFEEVLRAPDPSALAAAAALFSAAVAPFLLQAQAHATPTSA